MGAFCISYSILMNRGVRQHMGVELVAIIVSCNGNIGPVAGIATSLADNKFMTRPLLVSVFCPHARTKEENSG